MSDSDATADMITCDNCKTPHFVADLDFPEPDADSNTQFGWLVALCPKCGADIKVGLDRINALF